MQFKYRYLMNRISQQVRLHTNTSEPSFLTTGYDTSAHVAEETSNSHTAAPLSMIGSVINCLILGEKRR